MRRWGTCAKHGRAKNVMILFVILISVNARTRGLAIIRVMVFDPFFELDIDGTLTGLI